MPGTHPLAIARERARFHEVSVSVAHCVAGKNACRRSGGATIGAAKANAAKADGAKEKPDPNQPKALANSAFGLISKGGGAPKPAVAGDGGNIQFINYENSTKEVSVLLQGACSGCPSSTITLKNGIENMLKEMLPGKVETVEALNG